jgi:uncharacterized protein (TIGR03435 family)
MRRGFAVGVVLLVAAVGARVLIGGQAEDQKSLAFEVASVKQNTDAGATSNVVLQPGGGLTITAYTLFQLIQVGYTTTTIQIASQIVGGPSWLKSDRFDIVAKATGSIDADETGRPTRLLAMIRSLLQERFRLRTHVELRDTPVYLLVLSNKDGKLGPQLHRSAQDCRGPVGNLVPQDSPRWCGWRGAGTGHYVIQGLMMQDMAVGFAGTWTVGRPVLDRTGLPGRWDAQIDFVPPFVPNPNDTTVPVPNPAADSGTSLLSAIRDQLGLKLESAKAKAEFLVIDRIERPTPD